jgi:hypothetical protein
MTEVVALKPFKDGGERRAPGDKFPTSAIRAKELAAKGLVRIATEAGKPVKKTTAAGSAGPSVSLPAAPPSAPTTSPESTSGGKRRHRKAKARAESLPQTPPIE